MEQTFCWELPAVVVQSITKKDNDCVQAIKIFLHRVKSQAIFWKQCAELTVTVLVWIAQFVLILFALALKVIKQVNYALP